MDDYACLGVFYANLSIGDRLRYCKGKYFKADFVGKDLSSHPKPIHLREVSSLVGNDGPASATSGVLW